MDLPAPLKDTLTQTLGAPPQDIQPISQADFSAAAHFAAGNRRYIVKWLPQQFQSAPGWPDPFMAEAQGLKLLAEAQALRVPAVYAHAPAQNNCPAFIILEWITTAPVVDRRMAGRALGQGLAAQHRVSAHAFGLDHHNYCGATPQANGWMTSWVAFYGQQRLGFQMELAAQNGYLPAVRQQRLEHLIDRLGNWIDDHAVQPSLLHGDLWGGNWLIDLHSKPVLIDPAVYFGDREAELAMCHLFEGFPDDFFRAYDEAWPPVPGREERLPLYQLYHLLNHLNLFGESYAGQVDHILQRYVG